MSTPIKAEAQEFPPPERANAGQAEASPPGERPAAQSDPQPGNIGRAIVFLLVGAALGGALGYGAKPQVEERRFFNFDPESTRASELVSGWSGFEKNSFGDTFVWCVGTTCIARVTNASDGDKLVRVKLWPLTFPDAPPQNLTVSVNDVDIGTKPVLSEGMSILSFRAPASALKVGPNDVKFKFAYAETPSAKLPGSKDPRKLSAAFDWLELATPSPPGP